MLWFRYMGPDCECFEAWREWEAGSHVQLLSYVLVCERTWKQVLPELADQFIQQAIWMRNDDTVEVCADVEWEKIPEKYTKMQVFTGYAGS